MATGRYFVAAILVTAAILAAGSLAAAQTQESSWGYAVAHEIMSPFCPGRTLAACTSGQAAELRQWILLQEAAGTSKEEVLELLYERFGDVVLSAPKPEGWGLGAYVVPFAAFALGLAAIPLLLRRMVGRKIRAASPDPSAPSNRSAQFDASAESGTGASPAQAEDAALERLVDEELAAH